MYMKRILVIAILFLSHCGGLLAQKTAKYFAISVPVRDGNVLAADVYTNDTTKQKPVILIQTPYNKNLYRLTTGGTPDGKASFPYDSSRYNYVVIDWRGFYGSKSADVQGYDRGLDGYDAVEWIARQPWCNGKVGTWGPSALGLIQFQTASKQPPHLVCSVPLVKDFKTKYTDYYCGGDYRKEHVETLQKLGFLSTSGILTQPDYNAIWKAVETSSDMADKIAVPMLLVSGWFDHFPDDVLRAFDDLRTKSDASVRDKHKLIMGPWLHSGVDQADQGELSYPNAVGIANDAAQKFFDYTILGAKNGYPLLPRVRYYQLGVNEWRTTDDWHSLQKDTMSFYLRENNALLQQPPSSTNQSAVIHLDPRDPSPSYGGARFNPFDPTVVPGPLDIRQVVESRNDARIFTTPPFDRDFEIDGPATVHLYVATDRTDTDFSVRLCDVYPEGRAMIMTDGIRRLRFRNAYSKEELAQPGSVYHLEIDLQNLALTFLKGHSLQLVVASADYPRYDINLNNGGAMYTAGDTLIATNTLSFDAAHPSYLTTWTSASHTPVEFSPVLASELSQNYPNPCTSFTQIKYSTDAQGRATLKLYSVLGKEIASLVDEETVPGVYVAGIDLRSLPAGVYFYRFTTRSGTETKRMTIEK